MKIAVLGNGAWGTSLAIHLARRGGHEVVLWGHDPADVASMVRDRANERFLPGFPFPDGIVPTADAGTALDGAGLVLVVVPSEFFRATVRGMVGHVAPGTVAVSATKGLEQGSLLRMTTVLAEEWNAARVAALSGPTFAAEVARGEPTTAVVASEDSGAARLAQEAISDPRFRLYASSDPVGVEVAGALKNVVAIASGIVAGLGLGHNTTAALITRGLAELARLGVALGGRPETFAGLAGMGDLVLTCTGALSRNRHVGHELGQGKALPEILSSMGHVAEGVRTAPVALELARRVGVELPIAQQVGRILGGEIAAGEAIRELMSRALKPENG